MTTPTFGSTLLRGALAGVVAGLAGAAVQYFLTEIPLEAALAVEEARPADPAAGDHHEELFDRGTQLVGGLLATVVIGLSIGLVFAVAFARLRHRLPGRADLDRAVLLGGVGFLTISLLPGLKYPANPPGVGDPSTVEERTLLYLAVIVAGLVLANLAPWFNRFLAGKGVDRSVRLVLTGLSTVVLLALVVFLLPANNDPIPADIPAPLLWQFRLYSLLQLATLWTVLASVFGLLLERQQRKADTPALAA
ncbi:MULTISPECIES: CbtA family protein [unclassified Crossiella]|uniref:CbtA family protein n=1 Tax=unclassified Crossiella TaxID=2620835 RepID=UPI001FFFCCBF|nr:MULTISPECIES: CbtA family protein [unclassified Crossiella]MCK2241490.1 CbtA family protein [Crossiella sp. S99.2]MCK2255638.1 CbtA family protein [Crossiella sp. S99.1]